MIYEYGCIIIRSHIKAQDGCLWERRMETVTGQSTAFLARFDQSLATPLLYMGSHTLMMGAKHSQMAGHHLSYLYTVLILYLTSQEKINFAT